MTPALRRFRSPALVVALLAVAPAARAQDTDGDGAGDLADGFPCDAAASAEAFAPARGVHGLIMFEDQWPNDSDLDFNDVVVSYNYGFRLDPRGRVGSLRLVLGVRALGGRIVNGLGLRLPVPAGSATTIERRVGAAAPTTLAASTADAELTVAVFDDLRTLFGGVPTQINSLDTEPFVAAEPVELTIRFDPPVDLPRGGAPYDLFVFRTNDPSHEIHRPEHGGTARMNAALFGTGIDRSSASRRFVDAQGLPFALHLPSPAPHPREGVEIAQLFPRIVAFAASGGTTDADFYARDVVATAAYADDQGQAAPAPTFPGGVDGLGAGDLACIPVRRDCLEHWDEGRRTDGLYRLDPDGAGGLDSFYAYCDQTTDGGGWTKVLQIRSPYAPTRDAIGTIATAGVPATAKLADAQIAALRHRTIDAYFRVQGRDTPARIFVHNPAPFDDLARAWGFAGSTRRQCSATSLAGCTFFASTYGAFDTLQDGSGASDGCDRFFEQHAGSDRRCWATASSTERCVTRGRTCGGGYPVADQLEIFFRGRAMGATSSCRTLREDGQTTDGVYTIDPDGNGPIAPFSAYCDMTTDGGGWTKVLQIRAPYAPTASAIGTIATGGVPATAKLADDQIRALQSTAAGVTHFRVTSTDSANRVYVQNPAPFDDLARAWGFAAGSRAQCYRPTLAGCSVFSTGYDSFDTLYDGSGSGEYCNRFFEQHSGMGYRCYSTRSTSERCVTRGAYCSNRSRNDFPSSDRSYPIADDIEIWFR